MTRTILAAVLLFAATAASAQDQDPVTRRPRVPSRPDTTPAPAEPAPAAPESITLRGHEDWGTNGKLTFTVKRGGSVVMVDATNQPVTGTVTIRDARVTFRFTNCVYEGTVRGTAVTGEARFTSGPDAGKTWSFSVRSGD